MIDLSMTFEDMKKKIDFQGYLVEEVINPGEDPEKFSGFTGLQYLSEKGMTMADARVLSEKYLKGLLGYMGDGTGIIDYLREIGNNASMHGNKWDKTLSIGLKLGWGEKGFVGQISDCGSGFNYTRYVEDYRKGIIKKVNNGAGFINFNSGKNNVVSFSGKGNIVNYMRLVEGDNLALWQNRLLANNKNQFSFDEEW